MTTTLIATEERPEESVEHAVRVLRDDGNRAEVEIDGEVLTLDLHQLADGRLDVRCGDTRRLLRVIALADETLIVEGGVQRRYRIGDPRDRWLRSGGEGGAGGGDEVRASMPGRVVKLPRAVGARVEVGDVVVVLEAMKMENDVRAKIAGTIASVAVNEGDAVEQKALLLCIEPAS